MSRAQERDPEAELDNQTEGAAAGAASSAALHEALENGDRDQFLERLREVGFGDDADADAILSELGIEFSGVYATANEDSSDYRKHKYLSRNKRERLKASRDPGRLCRGSVRQVAHGVQRNPHEEPPDKLDPKLRRKINAAFEAKESLHSLAKGGEGLAAVSEVTAVTEHRRQTDPETDNSSSLLGRIFG